MGIATGMVLEEDGPADSALMERAKRELIQQATDSLFSSYLNSLTPFCLSYVHCSHIGCWCGWADSHVQLHVPLLQGQDS